MKGSISNEKQKTQTDKIGNRFRLRRIIVFLFLNCVVGTYAQTESKDVRTHPESYFLKAEDVVNSLELLPAPPEQGSALFKYDEERYLWGKNQRETLRGEQAAADANVEGEGVPQAFQSHLAFGYRKIRLRKYTGWFLKCVRMPEICPPDWQKNIICGYDRLHITMNRPVILPSNKSWLLMVPIHPDTQP